MALRFIAKDLDSQLSGSPTLYRINRDSWVVQGWNVTDPRETRADEHPPGEGCVEIPDRLVPFFTSQQEE